MFQNSSIENKKNEKGECLNLYFNEGHSYTRTSPQRNKSSTSNEKDVARVIGINLGKLVF